MIGRRRLRLLKVMWKLGFRTTPFFFGDAETCRQMGIKASRELVRLESKYHQRIAQEENLAARNKLYEEFNEQIARFKRKHIPQRDNYGYTPTFIDQNRHLFEGQKVLDFGCGFGMSSDHLSGIAEQVVAIDVAVACIEYAKKKFVHPNLEFNLIDTIQLPFADGAFTAAYSNDVIEHLHEADTLSHCREILRVLAKGGKYLIFTPGRDSGPHDMSKAFWPQGYGFPAFCAHIKEYSKEELVALMLKAGFSNVEPVTPYYDVLLVATK